MHLVIGGAYQGKRDYVKEKYQLKDDVIMDGAELADLVFTDQNEITEERLAACIVRSIPENIKVITSLHRFIKKCLEEAINPTESILCMAEQYPELIITCNELGCGLVPMETFEREYRETVGRITVELAKNAESVTRIYCGIGERIK